MKLFRLWFIKFESRWLTVVIFVSQHFPVSYGQGCLSSTRTASLIYVWTNKKLAKYRIEDLMERKAQTYERKLVPKNENYRQKAHINTRKLN